MSNNFFQKCSFINRKIFKNNLSILNFGNASIIDNLRNNIYIKLSGISGISCKKKDIAKIPIKNFSLKKYKNTFRPSVDTDIHIKLYKNISNINCIIHAHSEYATIIAQSHIQPECYGTTHADYFYDKIPLSEKIYKIDKNEYESQIAKSIIKKIKKSKNKYPGILIRDHGVIAWGKTEKEALNNLIAIEFICKLYFKTRMLIKKPKITKSMQKFHYERKHGKNKYYGQVKK